MAQKKRPSRAKRAGRGQSVLLSVAHAMFRENLLWVRTEVEEGMVRGQLERTWYEEAEACSGETYEASECWN